MQSYKKKLLNEFSNFVLSAGQFFKLTMVTHCCCSTEQWSGFVEFCPDFTGVVVEQDEEIDGHDVEVVAQIKRTLKDARISFLITYYFKLSCHITFKAFLYCIFQRAYLATYKQGKLFKNELRRGKHSCKRFVKICI